MKYLDAILNEIYNAPAKRETEYTQLMQDEARLMDIISQTCGESVAEELQKVECNLYFLACRDFFLHGLRFGLELFRL